MEFEDFVKFIDDKDKKLIEKYGGESTARERILSRTVKLGEEFGELCDEVLMFNGDEREDKLDRNKGNLSHEFVDVMIVLFLLAKSMDVDIVGAMEKKIEKINARFEDE
jgi:NTP pyrophosphatase (non-canonical NTP hydrolase)